MDYLYHKCTSFYLVEGGFHDCLCRCFKILSFLLDTYVTEVLKTYLKQFEELNYEIGKGNFLREKTSNLGTRNPHVQGNRWGHKAKIPKVSKLFR